MVNWCRTQNWPINFSLKWKLFPLRMAINYVRPWIFRKQKAFENSKECRIVKSQFFSARFCQPTNVSAIEKRFEEYLCNRWPQLPSTIKSEFLLQWVSEIWTSLDFGQLVCIRFKAHPYFRHCLKLGQKSTF